MFISVHVDELLQALRGSLYKVAHWKKLGNSLGIYSTHLDAIEKDNGSSDDCLYACLSAWLKLQKGGATWLSLVTALREIGDVAVADEIEKEYI